jgi:hypothetical protein
VRLTGRKQHGVTKQGLGVSHGWLAEPGGHSRMSVKIIPRRFDGRMAFVPEGQADSSQARSAWVGMQRGPVPEGRLKSLSVPQIFVVETELMPLQKRQVLPLKGMLASMPCADSLPPSMSCCGQAASKMSWLCAA